MAGFPLQCAPCLAARQMVECGDSSPDDPEALHDMRGEAVTVWKGMLVCVGHFNLARGFPLKYPDEPLDDEQYDRVVGYLESADKRPKPPTRRKRRG
jgi:hypothetical protein